MRRLREHWAAAECGEPKLVLVYGRRQVGKTFLLRHLHAELPDTALRLYTTAQPGLTSRQQIDAFSQSLGAQVGDRSWMPDTFASWRSALEFVVDVSRRTPTVLVLDELPFLLDADRGVAGLLQQLWDEIRLDARPTHLLLILTGSAVATMTGLLARSSGALFGRPDDELQVAPFTLRDARRHILSDLAPDQVVEAYAATGGYPRHLLAWDQGAATETNLRRLYGTSGGLLLRNGRQLIGDLPEDGGHRAVLAAIGNGEHRRAAIGARVGQRADRPLDLLQRSLLVRHDRPVGAPPASKGRYVLADTFLACWYALCSADEGDIEAGLGEEVLRRRRGRWERHLADVFEAAARDHARELSRAGELPGDVVVGRWWSGATEVDVLGLRGRRSVLLGEAKWQAGPLGRQLLTTLRTKLATAPDPVSDVVLATWSRGGGSTDLGEAGVRCFDVGQMVDGRGAAR